MKNEHLPFIQPHQRNKRRILLGAGLVCVLLFSASLIQAQAVDYETKATPAIDIGNRLIVDCPSAYTLARGAFDVDFTVYAGGGLIAGTNIGLSNFLMIGISYGANNVFAAEAPQYDPSIEFNVKWRVTEETPALPALAAGFSSQGNGPFLSDFGRYTFKSKGFYAVFSKSISITGYSWSLHGGMNYCTEKEKIVKPDQTPNLFAGLSTRLRENVSFATEYDFGLNDNKGGDVYGRKRGYLNASIKWVYFENLQIEFTARNLLDNRRDNSSFERGLRITYLEFF